MDFADIIIVVVAIIGAIISGITKSARKKNDSSPRPAHPTYEQWTQEDEDEDVEYQEIGSPPGVEMSYILKTEPPATLRYDQTVEEIESSPQAHDKYRQKRTTRLHAEDSLYSSHEKKIQEDDCRSTIANINIADVIIFSELLKPKHKEY